MRYTVSLFFLGPIVATLVCNLDGMYIAGEKSNVHHLQRGFIYVNTALKSNTHHYT